MTETNIPKNARRGKREISLGELRGKLEKYDVRMWLTDEGELRYYSPAGELSEEVHHGIWMHRGILATIVLFEMLFPEGPGAWPRVAEVAKDLALLVTDPQEWRRRIHNAFLQDGGGISRRRN